MLCFSYEDLKTPAQSVVQRKFSGFYLEIYYTFFFLNIKSDLAFTVGYCQSAFPLIYDIKCAMSCLVSGAEGKFYVNSINK